jgi:hypothetical protein
MNEFKILSKHCSKCKRDLPVDRFSKTKYTKRGYSSHCKDCFSTYLKRYYAVRKLMEAKPLVTKVCNICKKELSISKFRKNYQSADGWYWYCSDCMLAKRQKRYSKDKDKIKEKSRLIAERNKKYGIPNLVASKVCLGCHQELTIDNFAKNITSEDGHQRYCKPCSCENSKRYNNAHKEERRGYQKDYTLQNKLEAFNCYGGAICINCGEKHLEFLSINHIERCGGKLRKENSGLKNIYLWLKRNDYPEGYNVMCMSCNLVDGKNKPKENILECNVHIPGETDICTKCGKIRFLSDFMKEKKNPKGHMSECKACKHLHRNTMVYNLKLDIFNHYGMKCDCCGDTKIESLTIDHINGDGAEHRRMGLIGSRMYEWVKKNNYPKDLRLLCMNCNWAIGVYGYCPHQKERETLTIV